MSLSEMVRLGAGSATRSLAGSFAIWYANKNGKSYAEQIVEPEYVDLGMVTVPISSQSKLMKLMVRFLVHHCLRLG